MTRALMVDNEGRRSGTKSCSGPLNMYQKGTHRSYHQLNDEWMRGKRRLRLKNGGEVKQAIKMAEQD